MKLLFLLVSLMVATQFVNTRPHKRKTGTEAVASGTRRALEQLLTALAKRAEGDDVVVNDEPAGDESKKGKWKGKGKKGGWGKKKGGKGKSGKGDEKEKKCGVPFGGKKSNPVELAQKMKAKADDMFAKLKAAHPDMADEIAGREADLMELHDGILKAVEAGEPKEDVGVLLGLLEISVNELASEVNPAAQGDESADEPLPPKLAKFIQKEENLRAKIKETKAKLAEKPDNKMLQKKLDKLYKKVWPMWVKYGCLHNTMKAEAELKAELDEAIQQASSDGGMPWDNPAVKAILNKMEKLWEGFTEEFDVSGEEDDDDSNLGGDSNISGENKSSEENTTEESSEEEQKDEDEDNATSEDNSTVEDQTNENNDVEQLGDLVKRLEDLVLAQLDELEDVSSEEDLLADPSTDEANTEFPDGSFEGGKSVGGNGKKSKEKGGKGKGKPGGKHGGKRPEPTAAMKDLIAKIKQAKDDGQPGDVVKQLKDELKKLIKAAREAKSEEVTSPGVGDEDGTPVYTSMARRALMKSLRRRDHAVEEAAKKGKPELEKAIEFLRGKIAEAVADGASSAEVEELKSELKEAIKAEHARIFEENQGFQDLKKAIQEAVNNDDAPAAEALMEQLAELKAELIKAAHEKGKGKGKGPKPDRGKGKGGNKGDKEGKGKGGPGKSDEDGTPVHYNSGEDETATKRLELVERALRLLLKTH